VRIRKKTHIFAEFTMTLIDFFNIFSQSLHILSLKHQSVAFMFFFFLLRFT